MPSASHRRSQRFLTKSIPRARTTARVECWWAVRHFHKSTLVLLALRLDYEANMPSQHLWVEGVMWYLWSTSSGPSSYNGNQLLDCFGPSPWLQRCLIRDSQLSVRTSSTLGPWLWPLLHTPPPGESLIQLWYCICDLLARVRTRLTSFFLFVSMFKSQTF